MSVKYIDWSVKHNIMIENADKTLTPMDEPYFENERIAPGTWRITSSGDYSYLVEGDTRAIAIDTGYGAGNIREYEQTLTDKPLSEVINTHDHFDHTANNAYFERAYMSEKTKPLATVPFASFTGIDFHPDEYERCVVREGDVIELGGRTLEIFEIPDHAVGSIVMLDRKERLLFSGDEFMPMGKILNVSIATWYGYMQKLAKHRDEFDRICGGFGVSDASLFDKLYECTRRIMGGEAGEEMTAPGKPKFPERRDEKGRIIYDRIHPHPGDGGAEKQGDAMHMVRRYEYEGIGITYDPTL